jgi:hypothetical protein
MRKLTRDLSMDRDSEVDSGAHASSEQLAREQAVRQFEARRRFKISTAAAAVGVTLLVPIWAATEYRNAGGWPTRGFSQRSGVRNVWNLWIIYPVISLACMTVARLVRVRACAGFGRRDPAGDGESDGYRRDVRCAPRSTWLFALWR